MFVGNLLRSQRTLVLAAACAAALLLTIGATARALADDPQSRPATQATTKPSNPEAHRKARQIIDAALAKYRAAKSYADKLEAHSEIVARDKDNQDVGQSADAAETFAFTPPNRLALVADDFSIHCNGKQLWLYTAALDQYTEGAAPERLDYAKLTEEAGVDTPPHPVLFVLDRPGQTFDELFPMVREFTAVTREERDGRPGSRLAGLFDATQTRFEFGPELVPFSLWFDEKTGLLGEIRIDLTAVFRKQLGLTDDAKDEADEELDVPGMPKHIDRAVAAIALNDVRLDVDIPADSFVFKPEPGTAKVAKFDFDELMSMPDPQSLIGKPAPVFAGTGLDEKPLSLEGLKDRVVIVDFWATWCIPCVQSMPKIQKLAEKFADQPLTVVGINQDARGKEKKVEEFLKDKKITFRQFLDPSNKLGRKYKVSGIPCTFLIDKKGIVQAVYLGLRPDAEETMSKQIEAVLKGENLFDPAQVGQEKRETNRPLEVAPPPKP